MPSETCSDGIFGNGGSLEIQFRLQPVSTRQTDDGETTVKLSALYLPVVFVEQVFYRAADGQGVFAQLGFVARAYVNQGIGREGVLFLRVLIRLAEIRNIAVQAQTFGKRCIPFNACFDNHARVGDLYAVNQHIARIRIILHGRLQIHHAESRAQGFVQQVGIGIELNTAIAFHTLLVMRLRLLLLYMLQNQYLFWYCRASSPGV